MKVLHTIGRRIICCMMVFSFIISGYAFENTTSLSQRSMLEEIGLSDAIIDVMPTEDILQLLSIYQECPEKLHVYSSKVIFNPLEKIAEYMSMSNNEKLKSGLTEDDILQVNQQILELQEMSDEDLISLGVPENEVNMYRQTLQSGIVPYGQGDITSSEMDFSLVAYDTPDSEGPSIQAFVYFNWIKPFVLREFRDKIIVAWGGNLAFESYSAAVTYKVYSGGNWGAVSSTQQVDYYADLSNINGSGYYLFDQSDNISNRAQYGRFAFSLEQRGYENKYTNLIVQYAHQVFAITGGSVGISVDIFEREAEVNVSVDVSSAYDTSL